MKGGLYIIYTSLVTISVLSSCAFFILVVSEALQVEAGANNTTISLDGLQNVTNKVIFPENKVRTPLPQPVQLPKKDGDKKTKQTILQGSEMTFTETLSLNSVTTDGLPDTGQPPIIISLADTAKLELKKEDELLFVNDSDKHNDTKTFVLVENKQNVEAQKKEADKTAEPAAKEPALVVKATPMHEVKKTDDVAPAAIPPAVVAEPALTESQKDEPNKQNESTATNVPVKSETPQEDIPSFSEWAQKQLAEAEKQDTVLNHSSQPSHNNVNVSNKSTKLRSKNYASPACGAKIVAANPEANSASSVLSPNRDEYMLNTCNSRIWFIVELCEAVQAQKIEIANFELFSSTPKEFSVYYSDRFPTREWASVGRFVAKDVRDVQSFDLFPHMFGKFIKLEMHSHYGSEHYCPVSWFKVYGTSEFEVLEKESAPHPVLHDDDDDIADVTPTAADTDAGKNLFGSARDAVMSIMKKAAQVLVKTEVPKNASSQHNDTASLYKNCCSPSHIIVCDNCSRSMYNEVYELIGCRASELITLVNNVFLHDTLKCTKICQPFGFDFKSKKTIAFGHQREAFVKAAFSQKYLAALCNFFAIKEKKVVLNTSFEAEQNITTNVTVDKPMNASSGKITEEVIKESVKNDTVDKLQNKTAESPSVENKTDPLGGGKKDDNKPDHIELPVENKAKTEPQKPVPAVTEKPTPEKVDTSKDTVPVTKDTVDVKKDEKPKVEEEKKEEVKAIKPESQDKKETTGAPEEITDNIFTDSFLSELDQLTVDPTPPGIQNNQNQGQTMQKESVFLRLSNRVKTLERNMSLSGQYLEELSRRYKKQVEEMQKSFEKTVLQMTDERRKSNEREQKYLEQMTALQEQIAHLAAAVKVIMEERDSWFGHLTFFKFLILQSLTLAAVLYYLSRRKTELKVTVPVRKKSIKNKKIRRKSVEGVSGHQTPSAKKRRPSEEALEIARLSAGEVDDEAEGEWQVARRNRKRKTSILHRAEPAWTRQDSIGRLQETPIPLDEEEFLAPVPEPVQFTNEVPHKEIKTNGSIFSNLKTKAKARRLSSPAFLRTLSRQSSRSIAPDMSEPVNGTGPAPASPTGSLWSGSTDASTANRFGKQKKKSFKNIFRKVF